MRIAICGSVGLPAKYGGWETLVEQVSVRLSESGYDVVVYCSRAVYETHPRTMGGIKLHYVPLSANGVQSIFYDFLCVLHAMLVRRTEIVLILGVSVGVFAPLLVFLNLFGSKFIVNVDGIEWKRRKWGRFTQRFLRVSESACVRYFDKVIADNQIIYEYIHRTYGVHSQVITYGAEHANRELPDPTTIQKYPFLSSIFFLTICRIVPENNVDIICEAAAMTGIKTVILGNWNASPYGIATRIKYSTVANIELLDQNYNVYELNVLRSKCSAYIHGHECGGTNPSLVEAMAFGCPLFCFDVGFNRVTTGHLGRYFKDVPSLLTLMNNYHQFDADGPLLRSFCESNYSWDSVTELYRSLFASLTKDMAGHGS